MTRAPMVDLLAADMADQPAALARLAQAYAPGGDHRARLERAVRLVRGKPVVLVGSGASHAACVAAAAAWQARGLAAQAPEAGEFLHYGLDAHPVGVPVVVVTYSGRSAEARTLLGSLTAKGVPVVLVTENLAAPVAASSQVALALAVGPEQATATKSYTNTLALLGLLADAVAGLPGSRLADEAAERAADMLADRGGLAGRLIEALDGVPGHIDVVGRGPGLGTALYGGLVLRELLALRGGWMPAGHFRHGPLLDVGAGHRLIVVAGGRTAALGTRLATDAAGRGGRAVLITDRAPDAVPGVLAVAIPVKDELLFALLAALPFELYMAEAARRVGTAYQRLQTTSE